MDFSEGTRVGSEGTRVGSEGTRVGKRWTKEEEDAILALFKGGKKYPEIAKIQNRKQPGIKARFGIMAERMLQERSAEREIQTATGCAVGEDRKSYNQKEQHCKKSIEAKFPGHEFKKFRLDNSLTRSQDGLWNWIFIMKNLSWLSNITVGSVLSSVLILSGEMGENKKT